MFKQPSFLVEDTDRQKRWAHLTEGIKDTKKRLMLECLFDNTKAYFDSMDEDTRMANIGTFTTYAFPLIRRVFADIIIDNLVSVQPIPMPTAMIFFIDFVYSNDMPPTVSGDRMDYRAGKHNMLYASGKIRGGEAIGTVDGTNVEFSVGHKNCLPGTLKVYVNANPVTVDTFDPEEGTFKLASAPESGDDVTFDVDLDLEGREPAEIELRMTSDSVVAEEKRLKAQWSIQAQQDFYAYHGGDAEVELVRTMGEELQREITRMVIDDLYNAASVNVNWTSQKPADWEGSQVEWNKTLYDAVVDAGTAIYTRRLVQPNWLLATPEVCARFEKMEGFSFAGDVTGGVVQKGAMVYGVLRNKYTIISDPMFTANTILVGYRGTNFDETGYVYSPYIPFYTTPTIMDTNFKPRRAIMSRFARKLISGDFYATVTIQ